VSPRAAGLAFSIALHGTALAAALALVRLAAPPEPAEIGIPVELVIVASAPSASHPSPHPVPLPAGEGTHTDALATRSSSEGPLSHRERDRVRGQLTMPSELSAPLPPRKPSVRLVSDDVPATPPHPDPPPQGGREIASVPPPPGSTAAAWNDPALGNRPPDYPELARRRGWEGRVLLKVAVSLMGEAFAVEVARSSGREALDEAARRAVAAWRFRPATVAGVPVAGSVEVPVTFRLTD
jgi:protein TonB